MPKLPQHIAERFNKLVEKYGDKEFYLEPELECRKFIATILNEERNKIIQKIQDSRTDFNDYERTDDVDENLRQITGIKMQNIVIDKIINLIKEDE